MKQLDDSAMEEVARYFAALGVTMRLKILNLLRSGERSVGEIARMVGSTQANVSKHLALLAANGFVGKDLRGTSTYYRIVDPAIYDLCDTVCGQIGRRYAEQSRVERAFNTQRRRRTKRHA